MTITRDMPKLRSALNAQSWEWLQDTLPELANALAAEIHGGASPAEIRRYIIDHTGRAPLAARMAQAAAHLAAQKEAG